MARPILWCLAFSPILAMLFVPSSERWAGLATALGVIQGPTLIVAALCEFFLLKRRGARPIVVSKAGNFIAIVLAIIIFVAVVLMLIQIVAANT